MNSAQKAVVSAAKKDGLSPMEIASELMSHDITEVVLGFMRKREVAFNKLSEAEQDSVIAELGSELKKIAATACRVINANGVETVGATLKSLKIDGKLTATMVIEGDEPNRHVLTDKAHDKSSILIVLYPNSYSEGMSAHKGERDQKALPLDEEEAPTKPAKAEKGARVSSPTSAATIAKKVTELPPKLLEDARAFITDQQVCTVSGIQNGLKIGAVKAVAVLDQMAAEGLVVFVGDSKSGEYQLNRVKSAVDKIIEPTAIRMVDTADAMIADLTFDGGDDDSQPDPVTDIEPVAGLSDELYESIKAHVLKTKKFSVGSALVTLGIEDDQLVEMAAQRMETEGVLTAEDEMGLRKLVAA